MITINGQKAEFTNDTQNQIQKNPSINEILERMQNNYDSINKKINAENKIEATQKQTPASILGAGGNKSELMLSLFSMLFNNGGNKNMSEIFKGQENLLIKKLLENSNNPMLSKLIELMPKMKAEKETIKPETESKPESKKIDSYVKTSDYDKF